MYILSCSFSQTHISASFIKSQTHGENEERYPLLRARDLYNCTGCLGQGAGRYVCSILRISDRCTLFRLFEFSRAPPRPAIARCPVRVSFSSCRDRASRSIASSRGDQSFAHGASEGSYRVRSREYRNFALYYTDTLVNLSSLIFALANHWSVRNRANVRRELTFNNNLKIDVAIHSVLGSSDTRRRIEHVGNYLHPDLLGLYRFKKVRYHRVVNIKLEDIVYSVTVFTNRIAILKLFDSFCLEPFNISKNR